jgi:glycosyltransferase involved in cell wall biosynthesis
MSTHPVRVRVIIDSLGPGGAERSLAELLPELAASGFDLRITTLVRRTDGFQDELERAGFPIQTLRSLTRGGRIAELRRQLHAERPSLVHTMLFEADIAGRLSAAGTGISVLTSLVNVAYDEIRFFDPNVSRTKLRVARSIDRWTARHLTAHFHAVTEAVKTSAVRVLRIPAERVTVIRRGRNPTSLGKPGHERRRAVRERLGIPTNAEVVVSVGRQEYAKGQENLLEALAPMIRERPQLFALIVGRRGNQTARLEDCHRRLVLGDRVQFLGHRRDVPDLLAASDIFAFPSLYEGFGGSVVEAMALGLPVVCSDLAPLREVVEDGGTALVVPPGAPEALRGALETLLRDSDLRRRLGDRGRQVFLEQFTLAGTAEQMVALYRRVAEVGQANEVLR